MMLRRGRPSNGEDRKTVAKSVRLPALVWEAVEAVARQKQLNVHQAMRAAIVEWLARAG